MRQALDDLLRATHLGDAEPQLEQGIKIWASKATRIPSRTVSEMGRIEV
jgi:hypothetical protein